MFPFGALEGMQEAQNAALPDTCTINRRSLSDDGFGGVTTGAATLVASGVPCKVTQAQALDLGGQAGRNIMIEMWTIRVPYGTDLQEEDLVVWEGITLRVEDVKPRSYATVVTAMAQVVK